MTLRLLLVEDSPVDAKLVLRELARAGHEVEARRVETEAEMREALADASWDLVISDWSLPTFNAPAALATLAATGLDLPFIIVSGTIGEEAAVEAMRAGAHDFVIKDRLARLAPAVERELRDARNRRARGATEAALQASEARFARLAESGLLGIAVADVGGDIIDANAAMLGMLGYTTDDLEARRVRWHDLTRGWSTLDHDAFDRLTRDGILSPRETELERADGTRLPAIMGVAMLDATQSIAFVADLSDRKQAEAALRSTEEQLRQSQKMEAIGVLAGGIAHDFNNILSVILSYVSLAIPTLAADDPLREDLEQVDHAARRAAALTRQLLAFSRRQVLQPKRHDIGEVLSGMELLLRRLLGEDIELTFTLGARDGHAVVDRGQIEQVMMNLAVNARDAMPQGGSLGIATANVRFDAQTATQHVGLTAGAYVVIAVSDTGCGIDPATQARIFEPFFTTKSAARGTGLGLSTVLGVVQQSGGAIGVHSTPGIGTTFKIYLPAADDSANAEGPADTQVAGDVDGNETVLLVEDDTQVRLLAGIILRRRGYTVLAAADGHDALAAAARHAGPIALLLTDVVMPKMSGRELAEQLLALRPELRVLYMSGYTDDAVIRHGLLQSSVEFIQKPITPDTLARKVREVLDADRPG